MDWFLKTLKENYANFDGRARRKEFWMFVLFVWLIYVALGIISAILSYISSMLGGLVSVIMGLASLGLLIPNLAVAVRRLHDTGCPTWYIVFAFIPLVNLYFLYLMIKEGDKGPNEFGPDPKESGDGPNPFGNFPPTPGNNPFTNNPNV
ncbi:DUF805 domain-containing protein [Sphingobacterium sp. SGR-19]|uniref:DUF805 domain-containing protein n=1 Tax=Sphingobacterium sp. SGR-19 TaxID=2710886 RepID=UPI0013ECF833|nr:DUF805 domain-containing protein [Sphingobacterium sp. SGR-19]NGM65624.1 DUF805 domain-containing protein [Sphingobacterium sp. SGR-19]